MPSNNGHPLPGEARGCLIALWDDDKDLVIRIGWYRHDYNVLNGRINLLEIELSLKSANGC
jgi:hypothetical protein